MEEPSLDARIRQTALLRGATEQLEVRYLRSRKRGIKNPAIFILDLDDPIGCEILLQVKPQEEIDRFNAKPVAKGVFRFAFVPMPRESAERYLPDGYWDMACQLACWDDYAPANSYPTIVATGGAVSLAAMSIPEA